MDIDFLKSELLTKPVSRVINQYILTENAVCFNGNIDLILELKEILSNHFNIPVKDIEIVGSAKLGISLSYDRFGKKYDDKSDIDLVLISSELFDKAWHELLKLEHKYHQLTIKERDFLEDCYSTIYRGFISPEKFPAKTDFFKYWWTIFSKLSKDKNYEYRKIRGRLFKNWWFVEKYYSINLKKIIQTKGV